jgi:hypothetical protein
MPSPTNPSSTITTAPAPTPRTSIATPASRSFRGTRRPNRLTVASAKAAPRTPDTAANACATAGFRKYASCSDAETIGPEGNPSRPSTANTALPTAYPSIRTATPYAGNFLISRQ